MSNPVRPPAPSPARTTRRRVAYVVVGVLLAAIFIGGYVVGILRNMR
jgi:hypothetical protein